jgi:beta-mannosidase
MTTLRTQTLSDNWRWKQRPKGSDVEIFDGDDGWVGTSVPTEIFKDLLEAGKIEDPHLDQYEKSVQWVGEVDWLYRTRFTVDHFPEFEEKAVLTFDGLDTFALVYLNGKLILKTEVVYSRPFLTAEYVS